METPETVYEKLSSIHAKYPDYFTENNLDIFSCVYIHWDAPFGITVIDKGLPDEIRLAIEKCFD